MKLTRCLACGLICVVVYGEARHLVQEGEGHEAVVEQSVRMERPYEATLDHIENQDQGFVGVTTAAEIAAVTSSSQGWAAADGVLARRRPGHPAYYQFHAAPFPFTGTTSSS